MVDETRIYADDLEASGPLIQSLFAYDYPDGLTFGEMKTSLHGWVRRAAARLEEEINAG